MNLDRVVRPWLLGCGKYFGANQAHHYRWPDDTVRPEVKYFTYRAIRGRPDPSVNGRLHKESLSGSHDVISAGQQHWTTEIKICLHNDPDGFENLAGCMVAAQDQQFINLFHSRNANFREASYLEDETVFDDERVWYLHTAVCVFHTWLGYEHLKINEVVDDVDVTDLLVVDGSPL